MVKMGKNLWLFVSDSGQELSILESRKHNQAGTNTLSGGLQIRSTPQRIDQYGTEARGLHLSCDFVYAPVLGTPVNGPLRPKGEDIEDLFKV